MHQCSFYSLETLFYKHLITKEYILLNLNFPFLNFIP